MKPNEDIVHKGIYWRAKPDGYIPEYHKAHGFGEWVLDETLYYYSERYNRGVMLVQAARSDGATGAYDILSLSWWVHDQLCKTGTWHDGTPVTNWQASRVLSTILHHEGRWFRAITWFWVTYLFGCDKARLNGMFRHRKA